MSRPSSPHPGGPLGGRRPSAAAAALGSASVVERSWHGLGAWLLHDTVRRRILLLAVVGLLLAIAVFGWLGVSAVEDSIERTLQERLMLARAIAGHLDYVLQDGLDSLQAVATYPGLDLSDGDPEPERRAVQAAYQRQRFTGVCLLDGTGRLIWTEPAGATPPGEEPSHLAYVRAGWPELISARAPGFTAAYPHDAGGGLAVSAVVPVRGAGGEIAGLVVGHLDLPDARLQQIIQPVGLGRTARVDVVDREGVVIASTDSGYLLQRSDHRHQLTTLIDTRRSTVGACHSCHEAEPAPQREADVMALAPLSATSWAVVVREAEREALAPARRLQQRIILVGLPLFLVAAAAAGLIGRGIAGSIARLTEAAERIAAGDLASPAPRAGPDEIGRLAGTFEAMRLRLKASLEHVQQLNLGLEARVRRRTEQLAESETELRRRNQELSDLYDEIRRKEMDRSELLRKLIAAQEEERKRVARDLHDDTSQTLAALLLALETAEQSVGTALSPEAARQITSARKLATQALGDIHRLIFALRPSLLDDLGLVAALRWYAESRLASAGVRVYFEVDGSERRLAPELETTVFRIVQEAITNVSRHAQAESAAVRLAFGEDELADLVVEVEDDGQGFALDSVGRSPRAPATGERGLGLLGMRERALLIGGSLTIHSRPGQGTTVRLQVPFPRASAGAAAPTPALPPPPATTPAGASAPGEGGESREQDPSAAG